MTTYNQILQAIADAKDLSAQIETFSVDSSNEHARQLLNQLTTTMENVTQMLKNEINDDYKEMANFSS